MMASSVYSDFRTATIQAARDLYGDCSREVIQTTNAWAAVGVGGVSPNLFCVSITGPTLVCTSGMTPHYFASAIYNGTPVSGLIYTWTPPTDWAWSTYGGDELVATGVGAAGVKTLMVGAEYMGIPDNASLSVTVYQSNCTRLADEENLAFDVNAYPNPTTGLLYYDIANYAENSILEVRDMQGAVVKQFNVSNASGVLDLSDLTSGMYLLNLTDQFSSTTQHIQVIR